MGKKPMDLDFIKAIRPVPVLVIETNGKRLYASFDENEASKAFLGKLNSGGIDVRMSDDGDNCRSGVLPFALPESGAAVKAKPGDIHISEGKRVSVYFGGEEREVVRIARIGETLMDRVSDAFGAGETTVRLFVEWSE